MRMRPAATDRASGSSCGNPSVATPSAATAGRAHLKVHLDIDLIGERCTQLPLGRLQPKLAREAGDRGEPPGRQFEFRSDRRSRAETNRDSNTPQPCWSRDPGIKRYIPDLSTKPARAKRHQREIIPGEPSKTAGSTFYLYANGEGLGRRHDELIAEVDIATQSLGMVDELPPMR